MLTFEQPLFLLLLLPIGVAVFLAWRRMSLPFPRKQRVFILVNRLILFTLVICALAGTAWAQPVTRQAVVFVADISDSTGTQRTFIEQWIVNALKHKGPDDQVGIVAVGRNALVEQSVSNSIDFSHFESTPDTNYTDIAAGLRLAAAILPTDSLRRIVLLTDGQQNLGDALQEVQLLQQEGIRLDIVPLPNVNGPETRIDGLDAASELRANERFLLHVKLYSTVAQNAILHLYLDRTLLMQLPISVGVGEQEISFPLLAPPPGFHTYRVTLIPAEDTIIQNNEASTFVNVQGPPNVLVIEGSPGEGRNIAAALQATRINVVLGAPSDVPTTLDGLAAYSAVVLADVPAISLGTTRMQVLQAYVRDLGRGLVVSGGQNSYGVGGYTGTPLEKTLPVTMDIPRHKETPSVAVVLIVESLESDMAINISKEAAKGVINLLTPHDQVGISSAYGDLTIPMQYVTNKAAINHAIDAMNPNDPGSYLPDLQNAEKVLLHTNAQIKHVILLGDGDAYDNYLQQALKMASEHITISTVATNATSPEDVLAMQRIAAWGKGRFYEANDPTTIPQILLKETRQVSRQAIVEEPFIPAIVATHPILTGIGSLSELDGYVATTPKPTGQLVLVSAKDDPVLATWQYGLGRVAAWTSDAAGLWTTHWLTWTDAARWWANLVTWTLPSPDSALDVNTATVGGTAHITVDLPPGTSAPAGSQQQVQATITAPDLSRESVTLQPTAPARWEGDFPTDQVGAYLLHVTWQATANGQGASSQLTTTTGMVVPYSPEYRTQGTNARFLTLLAQADGGALLRPNDTAASFAPNLPPASAAIPITFLLLTLAALLLPLDIAARRLASLEFLVLTYRWLAARLRLGTPRLATQIGELGEAGGNALLGTVRSRREERRSKAANVKKTPAGRARQGARTGMSETQPTTPATKTQVATTQKQATPPQQDVPVASKLLEAKRKREKAQPRENESPKEK
jgi:uncharacterized membrane protein